LLAQRSLRSARSPASIARSAPRVANAWRSATPPRSRRHAGRTEDESAPLRDTFYLRRAGNHPGPAGR